MAEPALKLATKYLRIAVANFDMGWTPAVEAKLRTCGLDLTDLHNSLLRCEVQLSNETDADGAFFIVSGETTEDVKLDIHLWVNPDTRVLRIVKVSQALGARR